MLEKHCAAWGRGRGLLGPERSPCPRASQRAELLGWPRVVGLSHLVQGGRLRGRAGAQAPPACL